MLLVKKILFLREKLIDTYCQLGLAGILSPAPCGKSLMPCANTLNWTASHQVTVTLYTAKARGQSPEIFNTLCAGLCIGIAGVLSARW